MPENPTARDGKPGCPVTVWDGPYSTRCGAGASVGKCAHHGPFATTARREAEDDPKHARMYRALLERAEKAERAVADARREALLEASTEVARTAMREALQDVADHVDACSRAHDPGTLIRDWMDHHYPEDGA